VFDTRVLTNARLVTELRDTSRYVLELQPDVATLVASLPKLCQTVKVLK
jgi:hypothetical protein